MTVCLILLSVETCLPQEMALPARSQVPLFLKILTCDRKLETRSGNDIVIAIIYQRKFRTSLNVMEEMMSAITESPGDKIGNMAVRWTAIDISHEENLAAAIARDNIDIFYVAPLRVVGMESLFGISREKKIMTLTGVPEYVESGLSVGIGTKGQKPLIIINITAAKAEGVDFNSQLLKLARVIE